MLSVLVSGSLIADPKKRHGANGRTFVTGNMRVPSEDSDAMLVSLIAFSDEAKAALLGLGKGEAIALTSRAELTSWRLLSNR